MGGPIFPNGGGGQVWFFPTGGGGGVWFFPFGEGGREVWFFPHGEVFDRHWQGEPIILLLNHSADKKNYYLDASEKAKKKKKKNGIWKKTDYNGLAGIFPFGIESLEQTAWKW